MSGEAQLQGKVALVTGAALERGIGRGIALTLAEHGADVAINDVAHEQEAAKRVREIEERGQRSAFVRADVAVPEEAERMVGEAVDRLGRLDVFVNNAGVRVQKWRQCKPASKSVERVWGVENRGEREIGGIR